MGNAFGDVVYAGKKLLPGVAGRWGAARLKFSVALSRHSTRSPSVVSTL
jgi:hypothetical protein